MSDKLTLSELRQFTGTEHWYRHPLVRRVRYTDGIQYLADRAGAYWLIDAIAFAQCGVTAVTDEEFQLWRLKVRPDSTATLQCEDGDGVPVISMEISFTDFPLPEMTLYFCNDTLHLPSEY